VDSICLAIATVCRKVKSGVKAVWNYCGWYREKLVNLQNPLWSVLKTPDTCICCQR